jgi:transcriptional regulator with XRE-family HTH domain
VRATRDERNLSQEDLAHATGISVAYISEIEHGRRSPSLAILARLAAGFQIPLSELIVRAERGPHR